MNWTGSLTRLGAAFLGGAAVAAIAVAVSGSANAEDRAGGGFKECGFAQTGWLPGHAPEGIPEKFVMTAPVPKGWTVVTGQLGTAAAILVCR